MGLDINAIKLGKRIGTEKPSEEILDKYDGEIVHVTCENFAPFEHLRNCPQGWYFIEEWGKAEFSTAYGGFMTLRQAICRNILGIDYCVWLERMEQHPETVQYNRFAEMLWFSDCDGCFDYLTAYKLYDDFAQYEQRAKDTFAPKAFELYKAYKEILWEGMKEDHVVYYH